jgi:hypothetical protein
MDDRFPRNAATCLSNGEQISRHVRVGDRFPRRSDDPPLAASTLATSHGRNDHALARTHAFRADPDARYQWHPSLRAAGDVGVVITSAFFLSNTTFADRVCLSVAT